MVGARLREVIIVVVLGVWVANFTAGLAVPGYTPDQTINTIFMASIGSLFILDRTTGKKPDDKDKEDADERR